MVREEIGRLAVLLTCTQACLAENQWEKRDVDEQCHQNKASCPQNNLRFDNLQSTRMSRKDSQVEHYTFGLCDCGFLE